VETTKVKKHSGTSQKKVRFEMKLTPEEKQQIVLLSQQERKSAKAAIMMLVQQALRQIEAKTLSPKELMKLPPEKRSSIITKQFQEAEKLYQENPDLIVPDVDVPIDS
jgi:hypothetical protein